VRPVSSRSVGDHEALIESCDMFFLVTADKQGLTSQAGWANKVEPRAISTRISDAVWAEKPRRHLEPGTDPGTDHLNFAGRLKWTAAHAADRLCLRNRNADARWRRSWGGGTRLQHFFEFDV
jgi:hypothetical protein